MVAAKEKRNPNENVRPSVVSVGDYKNCCYLKNAHTTTFDYVVVTRWRNTYRVFRVSRIENGSCLFILSSDKSRTNTPYARSGENLERNEKTERRDKTNRKTGAHAFCLAAAATAALVIWRGDTTTAQVVIITTRVILSHRV